MYNIADFMVLCEVLMLFTDIHLGCCTSLMNRAKCSASFNQCKWRH